MLFNLFLLIVCLLSSGRSFISVLYNKCFQNQCGNSNTLYTLNSFERSNLHKLYSSVPFNRGPGGRQPATPPPPINQFIKADKVRLIIPGNETADSDIMVGIMSLAEAQEYADKLQVDLVMINDKGDPPVCKAIDYGKFKYTLEKKKKENAKKQVQSEIKEIKMSYKIEQHDFDVRVKAIQKFIGEGDRVSICHLYTFLCFYGCTTNNLFYLFFVLYFVYRLKL